MNRGVWVGVLALGLGGVLPGLSGQEAVWHPARRAATPATARGVSNDTPSAALGRPVPNTLPTTWGAASELRPFPASYRSAPLLNSPVAHTGGVEPIATVAPPGAVIAASAGPVEMPAQPSTGTIEEATGELFAQDRTAPDTGGKLLVVSPLPVQHASHGIGLDNFPGGACLPDFAMYDRVVGVMPPGLYFGADYLLWWTRRDHAPVLATTGNPADGALAGRLGQPGTSILNEGTLGHEPHSGARFTAGYFFDDCCTKAIEVSGFFLPQTSGNFMASSALFPVLTRPFFSLNEGIQRVQFTTFPGVATGSLSVSSPTQLWGLEANARCMWCCGCDYYVDVLAGFRYLDLREQLAINEDTQFIPGVLGNPFNGTHVHITDSFSTKNQFYGGQVGALLEKEWGRLTVEGLFKLAVGVTHEELSIQGAQVFPPGTPNVSPLPGGLFALNSNIGNYSRNRFAVVPEVGITLGWYFTENFQVTLGYNFLYWSSVARPGQQIDTNLDVNRIPNFFITPRPPDVPGPHPAVLFKDTDFWAQGITVGVRFTF
jgi:hypothetical protein